MPRLKSRDNAPFNTTWWRSRSQSDTGRAHSQLHTMRRLIRNCGRFAGWSVILGLLLGAADSPAADRISTLSQKLRSSGDFRVRTQAALALGVSNDVRARAPLCNGLADRNKTVRAASAAALGKLQLGGGECIRKRLTQERDPKVKRLLATVLAKLPKSVAPPIGPQTRYYVAIGPTTNKTKSPDAKVDALVRGALASALRLAAPTALAPQGETATQAEVLLARHEQLKPIFVWPKVTMESRGGTLKMRLSLSLFTYPGKAFQGSVAQRLSLSGASEGDSDALQQLIQAGAPKMASRLLSALDQLP